MDSINRTQTGGNWRAAVHAVLNRWVPQDARSLFTIRGARLYSVYLARVAFTRNDVEAAPLYRRFAPVLVYTSELRRAQCIGRHAVILDNTNIYLPFATCFDKTWQS